MSTSEFPRFTDLFTEDDLIVSPDEEVALRRLAEAYADAYAAMNRGTRPRSIHTVECLGVAIDYGPVTT